MSRNNSLPLDPYDGPSLLLVTTDGIESQPLIPPTASSNVHVCQVWRPAACWCGVHHRACDLATLTLFVGPPDRSLHPHPETIAAYIVPKGSNTAQLNYAIVEASSERDFGPWAKAMIWNLAGGMLGFGLIGYNTEDLVSILGAGRKFRGVWSSSEKTVDVVCRDLVLSSPIPTSSTYHVGIVGPQKMTLGEVQEAASTLCEHVGQWGEIDLVFWCAIGPEPTGHISVVFADVPLPKPDSAAGFAAAAKQE